MRKNGKESNIQDIYTLTPMQEGMMYHAMLETTSAAYFEQRFYRLHGELDVDTVKKSLNELFKRYDILRTAFINQEADRPVQVVLKQREAGFGYEDMRPLVAEGQDKEELIETLKQKDRQQLFDLGKDPLMRATIIQAADDEYELLWSHHHILTDGWCTEILVMEFWEIYQSFMENRPYQLPEVKQFRTYINWLKKQDKEKLKEYWKNYLDDYEEAVRVPRLNDFTFTGDGTFKDESVYLQLDKEKTTAFNQLAARNQVTPNVISQSLWSILLGKYNNKTDVVFGAVVSGRPSEIPDVEMMVGLFINTIPVRIRLEGKMPFQQLVRHVQQDAVRSDPYHHYPLADVQSMTPLKNDLIDHIFVFENYPTLKNPEAIFSGNGTGAGKKSSLSVSAHDVYEHTHYDFNLLLIPGDHFLVKFQYNGDAFQRKGVERLARHFEFLVDQVIANETVTVEELTLLAPGDNEEILDIFNNTANDFGDPLTIHQLFEKQAAHTPKNIALTFEGREMTYEELNQRANQLARMLMEKGLVPGDVVGLMVERSFELIVGMLGILKAGGAYLPIDPQYPEKRVLTMLKESQTKILIAQQSLLEALPIDALRKIKTEDIKPCVTPGRPPIKDFENLPKPNRTWIDYNKYHDRIGIAMAKRTVSIQGTRGCPYNCAYCHKIWPKTHVVRSAENIFEEVHQCYKAGVKAFTFIDDIFNLNRDNSARFFEKIVKEKLDVKLFFPNGLRTDILTREYIDLMMEAGLTNMAMALESASPRIQKLIKKNLNLEKFEENVRYIIDKYPRMISEIFMMIGFPTETEEEALMTLELLESFKWIHFPDLFLLKIFPNSDMYDLAVEHGVSPEVINRSHALAYHEIPDTIPFSKSFARQYQSRFLNGYFLDKERLLHVLPHQMKVLTEDELVLKYDSYLPAEIKQFSDLLDLAGISMEELGGAELKKSDPGSKADFNKAIRVYFPGHKTADDAFRVLLMDTSLPFSEESEDILYDMEEEPLGLLYLMTYIDETFKEKVTGQVVKSRVDFDNYEELKNLIHEFKPDLIGIRTLSVYRDFFHALVYQVREFGVDVPIIAGGPYATSDYKQLLLDPNVNLAVLGEGELTFAQLVEEMMAAGKKLPGEEVLRSIQGIAFISNEDKERQKQLYREIIPIDRAAERIDHYPNGNLPPNNSDTDLLYVIYTSGSTGIPKGVMLEHRNLTNLVRYQHCETDINFSSVLQFTTASFDVSFQEIFSTLIAGGKLNLVSTDTRQNIEELFRVVEENGVKTMFLPPSFLKFIFNEEEYVSIFPRCVEHIITAGEQLVVTEKLKHYLSANNVFLHNHYGPTESHVVTALTMKPGTPIPTLPPIGKPIANTGIYILDESSRLQPVGAAGELYIGGIQVGRGYFLQEQMTRELFVPNHLKPGDRLYKTGDLARWLPDGNIEFLGRRDQQVKIRGFRIELGEIENQLMTIPFIKKALVIHKTDGTGQKFLCAYIVSDEEVDMTELRDLISENVPDYMVPAYFTQLKEIPLTPNGKIDYKALPDPKGMVSKRKDYEAPSNETEEKIVEIWAEVLELDPAKIGVNDDFFDLGGNSLTILKVTSRINKAFDNNISVGSMFQDATVRNLANAVHEESILNRLECIIKLNSGKNKKNLFIIHPFHGMIYQYKDLAKLLDGQYNVFAIQARGMLRDSHLPETFDEMVFDYVYQILQVQEKGPFFIVGYCLGSLIGFKLVNLLEHLGHTVSTFVIIDEQLWIPLQVQWYHLWKKRFHRIAKSLRRLVGKPYNIEKNPYVIEYRRVAAEIKAREEEQDAKNIPFADQPSRQKAKVKANLTRVMRQYYQSSPYTWMTRLTDADLYNMKAHESNPEKFLLKDMKGCASGKTAIIEIPGHHHTLFQHPHVDKLVQILSNL